MKEIKMIDKELINRHTKLAIDYVKRAAFCALCNTRCGDGTDEHCVFMKEKDECESYIEFKKAFERALKDLPFASTVGRY